MITYNERSHPHLGLPYISKCNICNDESHGFPDYILGALQG